MKVGNLSDYRKKKNLSTQELGRLTGVSGATISRYETGKRKLPVEIAKKIAEILKISWWKLYD